MLDLDKHMNKTLGQANGASCHHGRWKRAGQLAQENQKAKRTLGEGAPGTAQCKNMGCV
jgi:hypothetical protein